MKNDFLKYLLIVSPAISMISGLFMAPWIIGILMLIFWSCRNSISLSQIIKVSEVEFIVIIYCLLSCLWAINPTTSILLTAQVASVIFLCHFLYRYANSLYVTASSILIMMFLVYIVFFIEILSHGFITTYIRKLTSSKEYHFELYSLDRGCATLSFISWAVLYHLINIKHYRASFFVYFTTLFAFFLSDSTSSLLGYVVASLSFLIMLITRGKIEFLSRVSLIVVIISMPIFASLINTKIVIEKYGDKMPISYTHRLIIWSFVYNKTLEKPILGYGIGNSRFVPVAQSDMVQYNRNDSTEEKRTLLSPLPLHPHNNIMQVFIELGALGLLLMSVYMWNILKKVKNIASEKQDIIWHAAATSMIINYFCIGMISFNMWQSWWMLIMFLGILILNIKVTFGHYNTISK